jgi:protocatechuate 3,4-dioxygenase beta subunit
MMKKLTRRQAVRAFGLVGSATIVAGCGNDSTTSPTSPTSSSSTAVSLTALSISDVSLSPAFAAATTTYTASVANTVSSVTVTAVAATSGSKITVNGTTITSGAASSAIALSVGNTTLSIVVTASDNSSSRTYGIVITRAAVTGLSCVLIPQETDGPYPLYSTLGNSALTRANITEGKAGVPLTLRLSLVNVSQSCSALANAVVYIWHCDKDGNYSGYGSNVGATFCRGFQVTDAAGTVTFQTIYPGWYAGRITHIHFEVFLQNAVTQGGAKATSQIAFPPAVTSAVYSSSLYSARGQNTSVSSFSQDNVFADGTEFQLATVTGDTTNGYLATLSVGVAAG